MEKTRRSFLKTAALGAVPFAATKKGVLMPQLTIPGPGRRPRVIDQKTLQ